MSPAYTNLNKVAWDSSYLTSVSATTGLPGINVALPVGDTTGSTTPTSPSTSPSTGGGGSAGGGGGY